MLEPVTTIAAAAVTIGTIDRFIERRDRTRQRRRLVSLAGQLPPGSQIGENYDNTGAGWWIAVAPAELACPE